MNEFVDVLGYHLIWRPQGGFIRLVTERGVFPPEDNPPMGPFRPDLTQLFLDILNAPNPRFRASDRSFECKGLSKGVNDPDVIAALGRFQPMNEA